MKRRRTHSSRRWSPQPSCPLGWLTLFLCTVAFLPADVSADGCPPSEAILPCRCSLRGKEIQIWCSHSNLPQIMDGIKAVERNIKSPIDELVLENNQLPALPGRFFGTLQIVRLMLRYNSIERVSNGWLTELENSLVEIYIVEPQLRSIPVESLNGMINMIAITIQSEELKHLPDFSGLLSLTYLSVQSKSLTELQPHWFRHLPKVQNIHINGGPHLNRLEAGLFDGLISLKNIDLSRNGINWIHLRAFSRLPNLVSLKLSYNQISDVGMIGRIVKDLENLKKLRLDHNIVNIVEDGSFVDLSHLSELHLNDNRITEIEYGAFLRTPALKTIYLHNNHVRRIHPESFLQASGSGVEAIYFYNNEVEHVTELRSLLNALPALKFLDMSNNLLADLPFGALRGHGTLEQLHLNNNLLRTIERDALMAMPALRELRMRNNSLSHELPMPFWNLPGLKGLDLSGNSFRAVDSFLLAGLPSLRRLDLSDNGLVRLDSTAFIHNPMLETLNISANELVSIHPATFRKLDRLFEVDASYNQLVDLIPGLPKIVERVSLHGNMIATLPMAASKALNLPNLRMLDVSLNRLEHLPKYGFQGTPQLRVLSLANNRLRALDDTTFIGAHRLELLHVQDNVLAHVDERAFLALPELRNLNLQGNKLEAVTDNMFWNNSRLEQLDLSHNHIRTISPTAFESQRSLEYLDLSSNALADMSVSLSSLNNLKDIDMSYNQIAGVHADIVSAWRSVVEIRLSNNLIVELKHGTFRNLPKLQYLDLSSNEIAAVEPGALKHLPDMQEFVLADNKLVELKDHVFEDMPSLLASHFQYNTLRYISPESFFNSPSMVFLNLSNNHFRNMENIGLRSMRNLEVLDLSSNGVKMVSTMPLKALSWLVELKMDNNQICKIQGSPFETMPRLRVLSMRNNRLHTIKERTFRNLRGNIAILDVDGNPIECSCEMQWLSVWLQETNFPYPGPKCQDGRLLRASRMDKSLCARDLDANQRVGSGGALGESANQLPLLNEHGDVFQRELHDELSDDCDVYELPAGERPLAGESEYFYDQYVDYAPANETVSSSSFSTDAPPSGSHLESSNTVLSQQQKPPVSPNIDMNNTILHTKYFTRRPGLHAPQSTSPFTFFGYPIPSLSLGRFFGAAGQRGRKERGDSSTTGTAATTTTTTARQNGAKMAATHRMQTARGKVRMYQPNSAEFEKYLSQADSQYQDAVSRKRYIESGSDEAASNETPSSIFKTAFREPASVERGGFRPMVPEMAVGGFMPVHDPRRGIMKAVATTVAVAHEAAGNAKPERVYVPVATRGTPRRPEQPGARAPPPPTGGDQFRFPPAGEESVEAQAHFVTETPPEVTSAASRITPPHTAPPTTLNTATPPNTTRPTAPTSSPATTAMPRMTTTTTTTTVTTTSSNYAADGDFYDDLEAQSVGLLRPPPLLQTTTAETILLIPPPEEHVEQFKRHSWVTSTPSTNANLLEPPAIATTTISASTQRPRPSGGRSTITKIHTPQTLSQFLPTAEEYYRTTPRADFVGAASDQQLISDAKNTEHYHQRKHPHPHHHVDHVANDNVDHDDFRAVHEEGSRSGDADTAPAFQADHVERKDGMDWYYESFKKKTVREFPANMHVPPGSSLRSSDFAQSNRAEMHNACGWWAWWWLRTLTVAILHTTIL